jgi:hypothetical protein
MVEHEPFTALDWIAVVLTGLGVAGLVAFPFVVAPAFETMFAEFGNMSLPRITNLALRPWAAPTLGLLAASPTAVALAMRHPDTLVVRRGLVVLGFFGVAGALALMVYGLYVPIVDLAQKIAPD